MKSETIKRKQKVRVGLVARKEYEGNLQVYAIKLQLCLLAVEGEVNKRTRERTQGEMKIWGREGHRGQFVRQTDRRLDGCAQRCSSSLTAQGEARLTPASHWYCILNHCDTSRSLSSLSLWEFSDPVSSSTKQQQSYFYILPGDNTSSSDRPPLIHTLPYALLLLLHLSYSHPFVSYHPVLRSLSYISKSFLYVHWLWSLLVL